MNKMASGSEGTCPRSTEEKDKHPKNKEVTFISEKFMRRGDMSRLNYGRHITNTSSRELENTTTNTVLVSC